jgi:hypothetical protein
MSNPIPVELSETFEAPALHFALTSPAQIRDFAAILDDLLSSEVESVQLSRNSVVKLVNLDEVLLTTVDPDDKESAAVENKAGRLVLNWRCSKENWELAVEMLKSLEDFAREHERAGAHQFLPPDGADDVQLYFDYSGAGFRNRAAKNRATGT